MPVFDSPVAERDHRRGALAVACRALAAAGHQEGVAGHVTVRDAVDPELFWINPLLVPLSRMTASDLVLVNGRTGQLVAGTGRSPQWREGAWVDGPGRAMSAAVWEHGEIYSASPQINAIIHTHSPVVRVFASTRRLIEPVSVESTTFHGDQVLYEEFGGLAFSEEEGRAEGRRMARALGGHHLLIEPNHGFLTTGPDVGSATWRMLCGARVAEEQIALLTLRAAGEVAASPMNEAVAAATHVQVGSDYACWLNWMPTYLAVVESAPEVLL